MVSAISPYFVSSNPAEIIAMFIAIGCAIRFSMLPTLIISIASLGMLQIVLN
ncbi:branched-chain amino acid transport [Serratia plymuthica A30]|uniref:Branched-chain amino acid ABC transporter n=3 Tax=Serratia TaxID=613 RepID=S4YQM8_SERPL|nr:branched-chain amino acid ABC transporter [Serratia plymuthica S13]EKF64440.1 branched-chain amino acid transport [Serratia plymuthica A30]